MSKESLTKEQLIDLIQSLYETNTGDFRRKVSLYLNRFAESQMEPKTKKYIQSLKNKILYKELPSNSEMENIESLRFELLDQLKK